MIAVGRPPKLGTTGQDACAACLLHLSQASDVAPGTHCRCSLLQPLSAHPLQACTVLES